MPESSSMPGSLSSWVSDTASAGARIRPYSDADTGIARGIKSLRRVQPSNGHPYPGPSSDTRTPRRLLASRPGPTRQADRCRYSDQRLNPESFGKTAPNNWPSLRRSNRSRRSASRRCSATRSRLNAIAMPINGLGRVEAQKHRSYPTLRPNARTIVLLPAFRGFRTITNPFALEGPANPTPEG
jgi:hypothetical protein